MATLYQRGESWYLNWSEGGQQFRRALGQLERREAERIRSAKEAELTHGVRILPRAPTVNAFLDWYLDWYKAEHPTTHRKAVSEVKAFCRSFGHRHIDSLRAAEVEHWKAQRLQTHAKETVGKELRRLSAAFSKGVKWGELDANPLENVSAPRGARDVGVKFYTAEQVGMLSSARYGALWRFMANTGLRRAEATRVLQSRDLVAYSGEKRIQVESDPDGDGRTKSGKRREVPLNGAALEALAALPDRIAPVTPDTLGKWFRQDARALGITGSVHRLRHTFCSHLAMAGVPLRRIQSLAGHGDYKTTEQYAHLCPSGGLDGVEKLSL